MAVVELSIHHVGRVAVNESVVRIAADDSYRVYTVIIHHLDAHNEPAELCLTLYGPHSIQGAVSVPFEFSKKGEGK